MSESRLSIVIDSRSAEQQAKDLAVVLDAATKAGINVTVSAEKAGKATAEAGKQFDRAGKEAKSGASDVDKLGKSMGDARSAAMSLRGALTGAFIGVSIAGTITKIISGTIQAEKEQAQLTAVLRSTGEAAGFSQTRLNGMAEAMSQVSTVAKGEINQAQVTLLAFTGIAGEQFPKALQAAINMAARTGMSVVSAAETIGRALDIPSQGLTALSRQGFRFSDEQKKLAERLEATGKTAEAQGIILAALEESYGGAALAARDTFGGSITGLKNQLSDLLEGSDGSLSEATRGVNELSRTLASDTSKQAFADFVGGVTGAANAIAELVIQFAEGLRYSDGFFDALGKYGLTNPSTSPAEHLKRIRADLAALNDPNQDPSILAQAGGEDGRLNAIRGLVQQEQYWLRQLERNGRRIEQEFGYLALADAGVPTLSPNRVTPGGGGKKSKTKETRNYLADGLDEFLIRIGEAPEAIEGMEISFEKTTDKMGEFAVQAARNIQQSMGDGLYDILSGNFDDIGAKFGQTILRMAADAAAANLAGALMGDYDKTGQIGGLVGNIIGSIWPGPSQGNLTGGSLSGASWNSSFSIPGRATGGPVSAGKMYEVNERKTPELLNIGKRQFLMMGPDSGHVTPATAGGGGAPQAQQGAPSVQVVINNNGQRIEMTQQPKISMDSIKGMIIEVFTGDNRVNGPMTRSMRGAI